MTIQVPNMTTSSRVVCRFLWFSSIFLIHDLFFVSEGHSTLYVESSSSETCLLGRRLTFACRQIKEYNAKVPPAVSLTVNHPSLLAPDCTFVDAILLTLAIIIGAKNYEDILEEGNKRKTPEHK